MAYALYEAGLPLVSINPKTVSNFAKPLAPMNRDRGHWLANSGGHPPTRKLFLGPLRPWER
jgi:hypothetical protein